MPEDVMQNALQTPQIPLFGMSKGAPNSLNILSLQKPRTAPAPTSHNDVRGPIQNTLFHNALTSESDPQHPYATLILSDIATILPKRPRSPKALWRVMERLSASALSPFNITITPTSTTTWDVVAALNPDSSGANLEAGLEDDFFFYAQLSTSGMVDAFMAFTNEILETMDAFGRLYLLPPSNPNNHICDCCVGPHRMMVAYLTEGEVDLFEAEGIAVDLL